MGATRDSRLADAERRIADLEHQLAECRAERNEALQRETAAAEVLQVINSSPGELAPVFDAILEKAHTLCGAVQGAMFLFDGEHLRAVATRGMPETFNSRMRAGYRAADFSLTQALLAGQPFNHVADFALLDHPVARAAVELTGAHTVLAVALRKDNVLLGQIVNARREVRPFSDKEIALLENFAAQAVIAIENARLLTETREALEQQTATAEVLGVINSSPGDLAPVFDAVLEKATRLCDAVFGNLWTYDGEVARFAAARGASPEFLAELMRAGPQKPEPGNALMRLAQGEPLVHIADITAEGPYRSATRRRFAEGTGARTALWVPLRKDGGLLGFFSIYRTEVRPFSDQQIALLQNFAAQAVIAMENARLLTETREALQQQTATAEVLGVINSSPGELAPVFDAILEKARTLCGATLGALFLCEPEQHFRAVAMKGGTEAWHERMRIGFRGSETPASAPLLLGERFVHVVDVAQVDHPMARAAVEAVGVRTLLSVPLRKDDRLCGMIIASRAEVRPYSDKEIALLENFAAQAVIAMENARLLGELRQRTEEVAELNRGLEARVAEQVEELGRVGRLKRFLAPQLAELIVSQGDEKILESHRREIVVVFCDLRGYTAFTETAEPEEVLDFLREYHGALGPLVSQFEGTLDQFSGDGIMVFFNDPVPIPDPAERAVRMAVAMREAATALISSWRRLGRDLGFGAGIAQGYATLGQIGFSERSGYTAIGTVCNVAARLCAEAKDGQILISQRVAARLDDNVALEDIGALTLKGLTQPVAAYNVPLAALQPALSVIEGGPQTV
jgi:class 3 adenylate cyclase